MTQTTTQIKNHLEANSSLSHKQIVIGNFLGGLAWGFGTVVGASVVVGILISVLNLLGAFEPFSQFTQAITSSFPKK